MFEVLLVEFLPTGHTINSALYCDTLWKLGCALRDKRPQLQMCGVGLLHDYVRSHVAREIQALITRYGYEVLQHPLYSPNLAPSDFHLFGLLKKALTGLWFSSNADVKLAVRRWLYRQPTEFYQQWVFNLVSCWDKCVIVCRGYVEK